MNLSNVNAQNFLSTTAIAYMLLLLVVLFLAYLWMKDAEMPKSSGKRR